jgi:hypothetical protein
MTRQPRTYGSEPFADAAEVREWFNSVMKPTDPKPSLAACAKFGCELRVLVNRAAAAAVERQNQTIDPWLLKDPSPAEELEKRLAQLRAAAKALLAEADAIRSFCGNHRWSDKEGTFDLDDIETLLWRIVLAPEGHRPLPPSVRAPHRPRETWHGVARDLVRLIKAMLRESGYRGRRLSPTNPESIVPRVGARAISLAYDIDVTPRAFAVAMRHRDRSKPDRRPFAERHPEAARIKVEPKA